MIPVLATLNLDDADTGLVQVECRFSLGLLQVVLVTLNLDDTDTGLVQVECRFSLG